MEECSEAMKQFKDCIEEDSELLQEVVVVGYGSMKKEVVGRFGDG